MKGQLHPGAFLEALATFERQIAEATQYWFAAATINEVAKRDRRVFSAFQLTPLVWLTIRGGLEQQAIVALGRVLGQRKANPVNIDSLRDILWKSRQIFSRTAFAARAVHPDVVVRVHEPKAVDFKRLSRLIKKYRRIYVEQFEPIRNRHIAHTDRMSSGDLAGMFNNTRIRDFERMLGFLNSLHDALWHMYYNGSKPTLRPNRSSVRALVRGEVGDLSRRTVMEDVVRQTRECLAIVACGAVVLNRSRDPRTHR
jgi:hypothetical protein